MASIDCLKIDPLQAGSQKLPEFVPLQGLEFFLQEKKFKVGGHFQISKSALLNKNHLRQNQVQESIFFKKGFMLKTMQSNNYF